MHHNLSQCTIELDRVSRPSRLPHESSAQGCWPAAGAAAAATDRSDAGLRSTDQSAARPNYEAACATKASKAAAKHCFVRPTRRTVYCILSGFRDTTGCRKYRTHRLVEIFVPPFRPPASTRRRSRRQRSTNTTSKARKSSAADGSN